MSLGEKALWSCVALFVALTGYELLRPLDAAKRQAFHRTCLRAIRAWVASVVFAGALWALGGACHVLNTHGPWYWRAWPWVATLGGTVASVPVYVLLGRRG